MNEKDFYEANSLVVFDKGIKMPYIDKVIYGFVFDQNWFKIGDLTEEIHKYVKYLISIKRWCDEGGKISKDANTWYKDEKEYPFSVHEGYLVEEYLPESYAQNPMNYQIKLDCNPKFGDGDLFEYFIIKNIIREQWKR